MKPKVRLAILLAATVVALGQTAACGGPAPSKRPAQPGIHPAVVRVVSPERNGMSLGSGTLVAVHADHGLVLTNWHVISDAAGQVQVVFPDGFRTPATVLKADREWDLAALAIWRPNASPVPIANQAPRPGDPLTIAGYGSGRYRAAGGWCTQYVSPGRGQPFEMVELSVAARQGDSGGPIFNKQGELAGVLFGSGFGSTAGSYCGRVQKFLAPLWDDFQRLQPNPYMIAQRPPKPDETTSAAEQQPDSVPWQPPENYWTVGQIAAQPPARSERATPATPPVAAIGAKPVVIERPEEQPQAPAEATGWNSAAANRRPADERGKSQSDAATPVPPATTDFPGSTLGEQLKTLLAAIGAFAILFHSLRLLAADPAAKS